VGVENGGVRWEGGEVEEEERTKECGVRRGVVEKVEDKEELVKNISSHSLWV
jgi:hypothetical protein